MADKRDYYEVLGVDKSADDEKIKKAYRQLAKKYLKDSIMGFLSSEDVQNFVCELDILFIVSSTGGGTGSGTSLVMANLQLQSLYM